MGTLPTLFPASWVTINCQLRHTPPSPYLHPTRASICECTLMEPYCTDHRDLLLFSLVQCARGPTSLSLTAGHSRCHVSDTPPLMSILPPRGAYVVSNILPWKSLLQAGVHVGVSPDTTQTWSRWIRLVTSWNLIDTSKSSPWQRLWQSPLLLILLLL